MARIALTEQQIIEFHPAFSSAGAVDTGAFTDIDGDWQAIADETPMVATNETLTDWIAARGAPTKQVGDVRVWEEIQVGQHPSKSRRQVESGRIIFVLPTEFGTVAIVERI